MGQLVVSMYVSFDGVVEGPGGAETLSTRLEQAVLRP